jgi:hypothetical protein
MSDHGLSLLTAATPSAVLAKLRPRSANDRNLSSTRRLMVPAGNLPSALRSPALTPVRISIPSSIVTTG